MTLLPPGRAQVARAVDEVWTSRLSPEARRAMTDVRFSSGLVPWVLGPWLVGILVAALLGRGIALALGVWAVGFVLFAVPMVRWATASQRLFRQVNHDYGLPILPPPDRIDTAHGVDAFDASVDRVRARSFAAGGRPTAEWQSRHGAREMWRARLGPDAMRALAVRRASGLGAALAAAALVAVHVSGRPSPWLEVALGLVAVAGVAAARWAKRRAQEAAARHLELPPRFAAQLPVTSTVELFDAAVEIARVQSRGRGTGPGRTAAGH